MSATIPFKRLILRAVLRDVSPMVARLISVSDDTELSDLHDVFQQVLESVKRSGVVPATQDMMQIAQSASGAHTYCYRRGPGGLTPRLLFK
jgi:hypothetical protein